ncbi:MAG TPA: hypothetical protein EYP63_06285 [Desulfotomaculum sp.]|nr:hypothetical protein [Desulfotomaculum sp.]
MPEVDIKGCEIICIETFKVYDFCYQAERRENNCFDLCDVTVPRGSTIECQIKSVKCEEIARTAPDAQGRANVTFAITVDAKVTITDPDGNVIFTDQKEFGFTKTVVLCAPEGTQTACSIVTYSCGPCMIVGEQACCTFDLCIIIQVVAVVKLLIPTFGFCVPKVCEAVAPTPPIVCPPPLFPPQCPDYDCSSP